MVTGGGGGSRRIATHVGATAAGTASAASSTALALVLMDGRRRRHRLVVKVVLVAAVAEVAGHDVECVWQSKSSYMYVVEGTERGKWRGRGAGVVPRSTQARSSAGARHTIE